MREKEMETWNMGQGNMGQGNMGQGNMGQVNIGQWNMGQGGKRNMVTVGMENENTRTVGTQHKNSEVTV